MRNLLLIAFSVLTIQVIGQTDTASKTKKTIAHLAIITKMEGGKTKGWFYKAGNDSIYLLPAHKKNYQLMNYKQPDMYARASALDINNINTIYLKKKNAALKGTLIGLGVGAGTGLLLGFASGDDPISKTGNLFADAINNAFAMTAKEKAVVGSILGGLTGMVTGAIIGAFTKKKFFIGGKKENYHDLQGELMKRLIIK